MPSDCWNDSKLVTGRLDAQRADDLERYVRSGGTALIAVEPDDPHALALTGVEVAADLPRTEWFVTLADRAAGARLEGEVAVTSALRPLRPVSDDVVAAATTSIRFVHHPTIAVRPLGAGRIVISGYRRPPRR